MINTFSLPSYKGFKLAIMDDIKNAGYLCYAYRKNPTKQTKDVVEFKIDVCDRYDYDKDPQLLVERFIKEIDDYLEHTTKYTITKEDFM